MAEHRRTDQVSLGCGTLILIALIVLIFSGGGVSEVKGQIAALRTEITMLRKDVKDLSRKIEGLLGPPPEHRSGPEAGETPDPDKE